MPTFSPRQENAIRELNTFHKLTYGDNDLALDLLKPKVQLANEGRIEMAEFFFWLKTCIRAFHGSMDAMGFTLRRLVVEAVKSGDLSIPNRDLAKLSDRRYNRELDEVSDQSIRTPTPESLKLGLRFFPKLFGSRWEPDYGSSGWQALKKLLRARNAFTHADRIEKTMPREAYLFLEAGLKWYASAMGRLLAECSKNYDVPLEANVELPDPDTVEIPRTPKPIEILDAEFYREVEESSDKLAKYGVSMLELLGQDTERARVLVAEFAKQAGMPEAKLARSEKYQFATRNLLRTLFSEVEGALGYAEFLLSSATQSGMLSISDSDLAAIKSGELDERLRVALSVLPSKAGSGHLALDHKDWDNFLLAKDWRDKVTHPRAVFDFLLLPSVITTIDKSAEFFLREIRPVFQGSCRPLLS